jgi:hypothetical protein
MPFSCCWASNETNLKDKGLGFWQKHEKGATETSHILAILYLFALTFAPL